MEAASRAIDEATGRDFHPADTATARVFTAYPVQSSPTPYYAVYPFGYVTHWEALIDDTFDTSVTVEFDSTGNGDYDDPETGFRLGPANNPDKGLPYTKIVFDLGVNPPAYPEGIEVTADWGWDETPSTIVQATLLQASRFWARINAPFGISGSAEMQGELRLLDKLDVDVALMVRPYRKEWWVA